MTEAQLSAEEVAERLPDLLRVTLAAVYGNDDHIAATTIGLHDYSTRVLLIDYGVIFPISPHDRPNDEPVQVGLTDFGREVIFECALKLSEFERNVLRQRVREIAGRSAQAHEQASDEAFHRLRRA